MVELRRHTTSAPGRDSYARKIFTFRAVEMKIMKAVSDTPLSVLDLAPYSLGQTITDALRNTRDLARHAEAGA